LGEGSRAGEGHGEDHLRGVGEGEERPVVVGRAGGGVGEGVPLGEGGDDVEEEGGEDGVRFGGG
jgi:hypothetical protein